MALALHQIAYFFSAGARLPLLLRRHYDYIPAPTPTPVPSPRSKPEPRPSRSLLF